MGNYYAGQAMADAASIETPTTLTTGDCDSTDNESEDEVYIDADLKDVLEPEKDEDDLDLLNNSQRIFGETCQIPAFPSPPALSLRVQAIISQFERHHLVRHMSEDIATAARMSPRDTTDVIDSVPSLTVDELRRWVNDSTTDSVCADNDGTLHSYDLHRPTGVNGIIDDELETDQLLWIPPLGANSRCLAIPDFSGTKNVSTAFTLNQLQHAAFALSAIKLLQRWRQSTIPIFSSTIVSEREFHDQQLLLVLGEEGEIGKNRVVDSLHALCKSWRRPSSLLVAALTGKAASIINGRALDTSFTEVRDQFTNAIVHIPDRILLFALVRLSRGDIARPIADEIDTLLFPLSPDAEAVQKSTIELSKTSPGERRALSIKIQRFSSVCAVDATVYKAQEESLTSMTVVDWKADMRGVNKPQQSYPMVFRVVARTSLLCLKTLTAAIASWPKPPFAAIEEDKRLREESQKTLHNKCIIYTTLSVVQCII